MSIINKLFSKDCTTTMKGIAILLIIANHIGDGGFGERIFVPLGGIGVAMFLLLSGFGLTESYKRHGLDNFWEKRLIKILIPYAIWIGIYSIYNVLIKGSTFSLDDYRYWFVEYIFLWYISFWFAFKCAPKTKWFVFCFVVTLIFVFMPNLQAQQVLSFPAGVLISLHKEKLDNSNNRSIFLTGIGCLTVGILAFVAKQYVVIDLMGSADEAFTTVNIEDNDYLRKFIQIFTKLPTAISILILGTASNVSSNKLMHKIGIISYELYLVHVPFFSYIEGNVFNMVFFLIGISLGAIVLHHLANMANLIISNLKSATNSDAD